MVLSLAKITNIISAVEVSRCVTFWEYLLCARCLRQVRKWLSVALASASRWCHYLNFIYSTLTWLLYIGEKKTEFRLRYLDLLMVYGLQSLSFKDLVLLTFLASEYLHFRWRLRKNLGTAFMMTSWNQMSVPKISACVVFSNHGKHMFIDKWNSINELYKCQSHSNQTKLQNCLFSFFFLHTVALKNHS